MMKIGIVTIQDQMNYGNRLQNYALQEVLEEMFDCQVVSLVSTNEARFCDGRIDIWIKNRILRALQLFPNFFIRRFGIHALRWVRTVNWEQRHLAIRKFYRCAHIPEQVDQEFDCLVVGSDQVWNYELRTFNYEDFFLRFVNKEKRIAVAPSFGRSDLEDAWKQMFSEALNDFQAISVREEAGADLVRDLTGYEVPVLPDPVMMLDRERWRKVAHSPKYKCQKPYVLSYFLGKTDQALIEDWAQDNNYHICDLNGCEETIYAGTGPGEFLDLLMNASLVCTDSFHGAAFSILFHIPFVVFRREGDGENMQARIETLLKKFGLEVRRAETIPIDDYLRCDFSRVDSVLEKERTGFRHYLIETVGHLADE